MPELNYVKKPMVYVIPGPERRINKEDFRGHVRTDRAQQNVSSETSEWIMEIRGTTGTPCFVCGKDDCPYDYQEGSGILWKFDNGGNPVCRTFKNEIKPFMGKAPQVYSHMYSDASKEDSDLFLASLIDTKKPSGIEERMSSLENNMSRLMTMMEKLADTQDKNKDIKDKENKSEKIEPLSETEINAVMPNYEPLMKENPVDVAEPSVAHDTGEVIDTPSLAKKGWPKGKKRK